MNTSINLRLLDAATYGDTEHASRLITCGADPLCFDEMDRTPLMLSALGGHSACLNLLIPYGGVHTLTYGGGALLFAAASGSLRCVRALIKAGADPQQAADGFGRNPLLSAINARSIPCVKYLLPLSLLDTCGADGQSLPGFGANVSLHPEISRLIHAETSRREALVLSKVAPCAPRRARARAPRI